MVSGRSGPRGIGGGGGTWSNNGIPRARKRLVSVEIIWIFF
jgi:hypothetical protein